MISVNQVYGTCTLLSLRVTEGLSGNYVKRGPLSVN